MEKLLFRVLTVTEVEIDKSGDEKELGEICRRIIEAEVPSEEIVVERENGQVVHISIKNTNTSLVKVNYENKSL